MVKEERQWVDRMLERHGSPHISNEDLEHHLCVVLESEGVDVRLKTESVWYSFSFARTPQGGKFWYPVHTKKRCLLYLEDEDV